MVAPKGWRGGACPKGALSSDAIFLIVIDSMNMQDKPETGKRASRGEDGMLFTRMLKSRTILVSGRSTSPWLKGSSGR